MPSPYSRVMACGLCVFDDTSALRAQQAAVEHNIPIHIR